MPGIWSRELAGLRAHLAGPREAEAEAVGAQEGEAVHLHRGKLRNGPNVFGFLQLYILSCSYEVGFPHGIRTLLSVRKKSHIRAFDSLR